MTLSLLVTVKASGFIQSAARKRAIVRTGA